MYCGDPPKILVDTPVLLVFEKPVRCLVCQCETLTHGLYYQCKVCDTAYHMDCWEYNNGCAVYGCKGGAEKWKAPPEELTREPLPGTWSILDEALFGTPERSPTSFTAYMLPVFVSTFLLMVGLAILRISLLLSVINP